MDSRFSLATGDTALHGAKAQAVDMVAAGAPLLELRRAFPDPAEAFICSPVQLTMRELARLYLDGEAEENRAQFPQQLRERCRVERWIEQRTAFQTRRISTKRDALIEAQAQTWAMFGIEFHGRRLRQLMERWESLSNFVQDGLDAMDRGESTFGRAMKDACDELRATEAQIEALVPSLGLTGRAADIVNRQATDRVEMTAKIKERLTIAMGAQRASNVFEAVAQDGEDPGGEHE